MKFTATSTYGSGVIQIHATGCVHAVDPDRVIAIGDDIESALAAGKNVVDPDNDWPNAWTTKIVACAKKI